MLQEPHPRLCHLALCIPLLVPLGCYYVWPQTAHNRAKSVMIGCRVACVFAQPSRGLLFSRTHHASPVHRNGFHFAMSAELGPVWSNHGVQIYPQLVAAIEVDALREVF